MAVVYGILSEAFYGSGSRAKAEQLADRVAQDFRKQPGFRSATYFESDENNGEYGALVVWDTKEAAQAALGVVGPHWGRWREELGLKPVSPGKVEIVEIYEPNA